MIRRRNLATAVLAAPWVLRHGMARSATRARIGLSLPLTGVQASVATELLFGYQLAFTRAKSEGVEITVDVEDDFSQAAKTEAAVRRFGNDASFVATSGIVGTPHAKAAIPTARLTGLPVIGLRSGASELRDGGPMVFHLRASYEDELSRMVGMLSTTQSRITVVASDDSFGIPAAQHVQKVAAFKRMEVVRVVKAERNGADIRSAVESAIDPGVGASALLILMITKPAIEAVRIARARPYLGPIMTMSFTAGADLAKAESRVYRGLGLVTAFPIPRAANDEISTRFREAAQAVGHAELMDSVTAAEGYYYASAVVRAVQRCGDSVNRTSLLQTLVSAPALRVGSERIGFDRERVGRHFLQVVHFDARGMMRA